MLKTIKALYRTAKIEYHKLTSERIATRVAKEISDWEDSLPKPQWEPKEGEYWLDINMDVFEAIPLSEEEEKMMKLRQRRFDPYRRKAS